MKLIKLIVHAIDKTPDAGASQLNLSQQEMPASENLISFLNELNSNFNSKLAKTHGAFEEDKVSETSENSALNDSSSLAEGSNLFYSGLTKYLHEDVSFLDFSHQSMDFLKSLMDKNGKTKGGYIVLAHYQLFA